MRIPILNIFFDSLIFSRNIGPYTFILNPKLIDLLPANTKNIEYFYTIYTIQHSVSGIQLLVKFLSEQQLVARRRFRLWYLYHVLIIY